MNELKELVFILVGSRKRVGKDSFSRMLVNNLIAAKRNVVSTSFAYELKLEAQSMFDAIGLKANAFTEDAHEKENIVRPILIALGMARRAIDPNYWVDKVHRFAGVCQDRPDISNSPDKTLFVVVSDWRFPNELTHLRGLGVQVIGIDIDRGDIANTIPEEIENSPKCRALARTWIANNGDLTALADAATVVAYELNTEHPNGPSLFNPYNL